MRCIEFGRNASRSTSIKICPSLIGSAAARLPTKGREGGCKDTGEATEAVGGAVAGFNSGGQTPCLVTVQSFPQDCHTRAWAVIGNYMESQFSMFCGKASDAESTVMPASRSWVRETISELGSQRPDDHQLVVFLNCPCIGIISAEVHSYITNYITNILADFPSNGVVLLIHPNRAGQQEGRTGFLFSGCQLLQKRQEGSEGRGDQARGS